MPERHTIYTTQGFTLVEISIVLVVIGLLVGGILERFPFACPTG
jgi:prepilin-type N-terminal cleavage/methylation domain-containing protein